MAKNISRKSFQDIIDLDYHEDEVTTTYTKEDLVRLIGKSEKTIRNWVKALKNAYHWEAISTFHTKSETGKLLYSNFTYEQLLSIKNYLASGGNLEGWVKSISQQKSTDFEEGELTTCKQSFPRKELEQESNLANDNPHQIEVQPLTELPVLQAEVVEFTPPKELQQRSINDKLQDLVQLATAKTAQDIEEANAVAAQADAAKQQLTQLSKLQQMSERAKASKEANQGTLEQMEQMLKSINSSVGK
ncbi:MAG: hypothetical protein WBG70_01675 [Spirulinaceae cyanobacterium]